jgi:hypothetical protein
MPQVRGEPDAALQGPTTRPRSFSDAGGAILHHAHVRPGPEAALPRDAGEQARWILGEWRDKEPLTAWRFVVPFFALHQDSRLNTEWA